MTRSRFSVRRALGGVALAGSLTLAALALVSLAAEPSSSPDIVDRETITIPSDLSALRVVVDPESGALRAPTAAEAQAFDLQFQQEIATKVGDAEVYTLSNGALGARLGTAGINAAVVTMDDHGHPAVGCLEHDDGHPSRLSGEEVQ